MVRDAGAAGGDGYLVECALCDAREDVNHRIVALLLRCLGEIHNAPAVREELTVKELVHQPHLHDDIHQAEEFAHPVANRIQLVSLQKRNYSILIEFDGCGCPGISA